MPAKRREPKPDLESALMDTPLSSPAEFRKDLKAIFSVPKAELLKHIEENPDPPQKRGRKPKKSQ